MAKILELESDANMAVEQQVPNASPEEMKKQGFENAINRLMKKSYVLGLSNGVRAALIDVLLEINKDSKMNAAKRLLHIKQICEKRIDELKNQAGVKTEENESKKGEENNET